MMLRKSGLALALLVGLVSGAWAADTSKAYDLLFRNGTLDDVDRSASLIYRRDVTNSLLPEAADRDSGQVALSFAKDGTPMATLELRQDDKARGLGRFPASVGNPVIMFFYETTVRDMAEAAGGSPYYIRNRLKEALVNSDDLTEGTAEVDGKTVNTRIVRLVPFEGDPNAARMQGFGDLELRVTMSDEVPGWYLSLVAEAGGVYRSELAFDTLEAGK